MSSIRRISWRFKGERGTQGCSRNNQGEPRGIPGTIKGNLGGIPGTIKRNPGVFEEPWKEIPCYSRNHQGELRGVKGNPRVLRELLVECWCGYNFERRLNCGENRLNVFMMHGWRLLFNVKDVTGALLNTPGLGSEFTEFETVLDAYILYFLTLFCIFWLADRVQNNKGN